MALYEKIGIISGYFNPCHAGHIDYINAAKEKCGKLIAIVNNDDQVKLKGSIPFMDAQHRCIIVGALKNIYSVILSIDTDETVMKTVKYIFDSYGDNNLSFFNSGDRNEYGLDGLEKEYIESLGIKYVFLPLPKKYSSSELIKKAANELIRKYL